MSTVHISSKQEERSALKTSVVQERDIIYTSIQDQLTDLESIKLKKEIMDLVALHTKRVNIVFELSLQSKLPNTVRETLFSLLLIKQIRKIAFTGNPSSLGLTTQIFGFKRNIRFLKSKQEAVTWLEK